MPNALFKIFLYIYMMLFLYFFLVLLIKRLNLLWVYIKTTRRLFSRNQLNKMINFSKTFWNCKEVARLNYRVTYPGKLAIFLKMNIIIVTTLDIIDVIDIIDYNMY